MLALLDVNVLVALIDEDHASHEISSGWFDLNYENGWLTCPLTQNGCVRILTQPQYHRQISIIAATERLRNAVSEQHHTFVSDDISILDGAVVDARRLSGYRQLTDACLLALAVAHGARLITLDTRIPLSAVRGATSEHLVFL